MRAPLPLESRGPGEGFAGGAFTRGGAPESRTARRTDAWTAGGTGAPPAERQSESVRRSASQAAEQRGQAARWRSICAQRSASTSPSRCREKRSSTSGHPGGGRRGGGLAQHGRELLAHGDAGAVEAALHRVDADAQRGGDLGRRQALDVAQHQHVAVGAGRSSSARESASPISRSPAASSGRAAGSTTSAAASSSFATAGRGRPRPPPPLLDAEAPRDGVEPGAEGRVAAELAERAGGGEERLLEHVARVLRVAAHPQAEAVDRPLEAGQEVLHRAGVAALRRLEQLVVAPGLGVAGHRRTSPAGRLIPRSAPGGQGSSGSGIGRSTGYRRRSSVYGASGCAADGSGDTGQGIAGSDREALRAARGGLEARERRRVERAALGVPDVVGAGAERAPAPGVDHVEAERVVDAEVRRAGVRRRPGAEAHAAHVLARLPVGAQRQRRARSPARAWRSAVRGRRRAPRCAPSTSRRSATCPRAVLLAEHVPRLDRVAHLEPHVAGLERADERAAQLDERAVGVGAAARGRGARGRRARPRSRATSSRAAGSGRAAAGPSARAGGR